MKKFSILALLIVLLAACASGNSNSNENKSQNENNSQTQSQSQNQNQSKGSEGTEQAKEVKIDIVWYNNATESESLKKIIENYKQQNSNVTFNIIEVPYSDMVTKIKMMVAGGDPPELARVTGPNELKDSLLDLSEYVDREAFLDQFIEVAQPYAQYDGKLVAAPIDTTANGLIYNKDLFDKAGVSVPTSPDEVWTWEEFADALKQVMEKGGARFGLSFDFSTHRFSTLIYQAGGQIFNDQNNGMAINTPEFIRTLKYFKQLHDEKIIPESIWLGGENPNNLFRTGQTAVHFSGNWMLSNYRDNLDFNWGVTYLPKDKTRSSVGGGNMMVAFKDTGNEKEAVDFLQFFISQEQNALFSEENLLLSSRKDNGNLNYEFGSDMFKIFADELAVTPQAAGRDWSSVHMAPFGSEYKATIVSVLRGEISPEDAAQHLESFGNEVIEE